MTHSATSPPSPAQQELCPGLGFLTSPSSWKEEPDPPGWSYFDHHCLAPGSPGFCLSLWCVKYTLGQLLLGQTVFIRETQSNQSASFPYPQDTQESRHLREVFHPQPLIRVEKGQGWGQPHWLRGQAQVGTGPTHPGIGESEEQSL